MPILERILPTIITRRLTIDTQAQLSVVVPVQKADGSPDNSPPIDVTNTRVIADVKNLAFFWMRLTSGEAPEIVGITPAGKPLPKRPPARIDEETGRKHNFQKAMGLFVMLEGEYNWVGRFEVASKEAYIINSFIDLNNGEFNEQEADYEGKVPVIEIKDTRNLTNWSGNPVKEIVWGIYTWVERPAKLPDVLFSKVVNKEDEEEKRESTEVAAEEIDSIPF